MFYAHSRRPEEQGSWQDLREHLDSVATLAEEFAPLEWKAHARLAGLWHDVGKYQSAFQRYIASDPEVSNESVGSNRVQHSIVGASLSWKNGPHGWPIALAVQAHHGKLKTVNLLRNAVENVGKDLLGAAKRNGMPPDLMRTPVPKLPAEAQYDALYLALGIRFVFSALVDADSLDTERWDRGEARETRCSTIAELADRTEAACRERSREALTKMDSALNRLRAEVLEQCLASAELAPGLFTLTVPTGGGKTLSGLAVCLQLDGAFQELFGRFLACRSSTPDQDHRHGTDQTELSDPGYQLTAMFGRAAGEEVHER